MYNRIIILIAIFICITSTINVGAQILRDPTKPYTKASIHNTTVGGIKIKAFLFSKNKKALILDNDKHVAIGDRLFNARIVDINHNEITLTKEKDKTFTVPIIHSAIKTKSTNDNNGERS